MTALERLEREIEGLNRNELAALRDWFRKYDEAEWDQQIEEDVKSGKLDHFTEQALTAHNTGRTKAL